MKLLKRQKIEEIYGKILDICKESTAIKKLHKVINEIPIQKGSNKVIQWIWRRFLGT